MHKSLSRLLTFTLAAALLVQPALAAGQAAAPEGWTSPFSDVAEKDWYYPYVATLNSQGVIDGYPDGRFGAKDPVSAGAALVMVLKGAGLGTMTPQEGTHWASAYSNFAVARGWLTEEDTAQLDGAIPRLRIVQLAAQALGLSPSKAPSPFADADDGYATVLYQQGLLAGNQEGGQLLLKPRDSITRAEISAIVWQVQRYASQIRIAGKTVPVLAAIPANSYDLSAFQSEDGRMTYTADGVNTALGIDVSSHQGTIDWDKVADDGIQFAMIRSGGRYYGSGVMFEDTQFQNNIKGAIKAGLDVGVYFFSQAVTVEEAQEEAQFVLDLIEEYDLTGPVVFDWENISDNSARTNGVDRATLTAMANAFCETVEEAGYPPMIYLNQYLGYLRYDLEGVIQYPFWLAQYNAYPGFRYDFQMWQYTDAGQVDGIDSRVDLNLWLLPQ